MKMKKILAALMSLTLCAGILTACGDTSPSASDTSSQAQSDSLTAESTIESDTIADNSAEENKTTAETAEPDPYAGLTLYESATGISIYMSEGYTEGSMEGIPCFFEGELSNVSCSNETFETLAALGYSSDMSLEAYGELILQAYQLEGEVLTDDYGNVYVAYTQDIQGMSVSYFSFFDKGADSFWTTNFMCPTEVADTYEEDFKLWASSLQVP